MVTTGETTYFEITSMLGDIINARALYKINNIGEPMSYFIQIRQSNMYY